MNKDQIESQLKRYKETIKAIKKRTGFKSVQLIAEQMNYSRGETISEYGSIKHYKPEKFRDFMELLAKVFDVNPSYILEGRGPVFKVKTQSAAAFRNEMTPQERREKIEGLEYSRAILESHLRRLREEEAAEQQRAALSKREKSRPRTH